MADKREHNDEYILVYSACPECDNEGVHTGGPDGMFSCMGPGRSARRLYLKDLPPQFRDYLTEEDS